MLSLRSILRVADPHYGRYRDPAKLDRPAIFRFN
jgi:hypothetical protein